MKAFRSPWQDLRGLAKRKYFAVNDFSVIIPTYNRADLLCRAVDSVVRSSGSRAEVIVVDDGSTDATRQVLAELQAADRRVRGVVQEQSGAAAARNRGAEQATGDVLLFLDSDDELLPQAIDRLTAAFSRDCVGAVCSAAEFVNGEGEVKSISRPRDLGPAYEGFSGLFLAGTFAVRRPVFEAVGGFAAECRSSQHTEFALRLTPYLKCQGLELVALDEPTVRVTTDDRVHLRGNLQNLLEGALYIIRTHERQLQKSPKHYSDWCSIAAVYAAKLGRLAQTRQLLTQAVRWYPRKTANLARLAVACVPPLARRVWRRGTVR